MASVLLLLIYCLMYFPLFVGVLCLSLFYYVLLCVNFAIIVLQMYCYYKFFVALPHSAVGWLYYCGISLSYSLTFVLKYILVLTVLLECKTEKQNSQCEHGQPMEQTRGLFCMCDSGVAHCQLQHQCHIWRIISMFKAYCTGK